MQKRILSVSALLLCSLACAQPRHPRPPHHQPRLEAPPMPREPFRGEGPANRLTLSFPNIVFLNGRGGYSAGINYERALLSSGRLSLLGSLRYFHCGEFRLSSIRGDRRTLDEAFAGSLAAVYRPLGSRRRIDPGIGIGVLTGRVTRRISTVGYNPPPATGSWPMTGPFAQLDMHVNNRGPLAFGVELRAGPLFGAARSGDAFLEFGVKVGVQF